MQKSKIKNLGKKKFIPPRLQPILWSKTIKNLDLERDKNYIVHQILGYGNLKAIKWLLRAYGKEEIRNIFMDFPKNIYRPAIFYFIKNFILGLTEKPLDVRKYVKTIP